MANLEISSVLVHAGVEDAPEPFEAEPERPFRILLAGDFSGRAWRSDCRPVVLRPIDRDNFDDVLHDQGLEVDVEGVRLQFYELEDFHPDRIWARVGKFEEMHRTGAADTPAPATPPPAGGNILDQILAEEEGTPPAMAADANDLAGFIRRASAGHVVPRQSAEARESESARTAAAGRFLRSILHHPRFQATEAAWRAALMVVRGLDTAGGTIEIHVLDATLPELIAQMEGIHKELARKGPWGCIAGNYVFGQTQTDVEVLSRLGALARSLRAPFLAEGRLPEDVENAVWEEFRRSDAARWIGLALPRFLLRLPYGKDMLSIDSFPFEEMTENEHGAYLWGNPAFFCALLIGQSFLLHGWNLGRRLVRRIDGLPQAIYLEDGEPCAKPCAEIWMTEREAESILEAGFMPLASIKNEPAALIVRFQSVARPARGLEFGTGEGD
ncbi:MAG TPA: type VI secretion system contractile sheath large subunit [Bryobacteraceae bacterium]|nr:type VI secretion system contractile sheath large subunit [Bryobacteraceae bacterium]